ncbi:MAG TPA: efflux RND transporter periplasmic adaptor subunit [Opitutaceae bacterium]|nr:efflux RND transporter periplasmic adaptor subunit [Opitutaceae bacterium]
MSKPGSSGRWIVIIILLLLAGSGGWYYWNKNSDKAPEYYTTKVARGDLEQKVTATGVIQPVLDVLVSSQISGYINSLSADFNSKVKKGDLLCTLLPTNYQAALKSAEGDLANAKANYDLQKVNVDRSKQLLDKNLIAQSDYDQAAALFEQATAQVQIKTASVETARANLSYTEIRSPIDGIVIKRAVDIGNSVSASLNSPTLFEIANDLTKMQIDASVAEADIGNIAEGQDVSFSVDAYPNRTFRGKVFQIRNAPETQQNVVIYDVMISVDNGDLKLKPGMTANALITVARRADALLVTNGALRFRMPDNIETTTAPDPAKAGEKPAESAPAPAAPVKKLSQDEQRQAMREIFQEAGFQRGTPATPEMIQKIQDLAKQRGVEIPERMMAFLTGGGGRRGGPDAPVFRDVFRLPGGNASAKPEKVRVKVGITDGSNTEILAGLNEGDVIITGLSQPLAAQPAGPTGGPFGGGRRF